MPVIGKVKVVKPFIKRLDERPRPKLDKRKRPKVYFACDECGDVFTVSEAEAKDRRFCSKECADVDKQIPLSVRFNTKWELVPSGCWEWRGRLNEYGYGTIRDGEKNALAHRVSLQLFKGGIPEGMLACHKCGVRLCVNPAHLYAGTHADNMKDLAIDNTSSFSKTSWDQRREMVSRLNSGEPVDAVALAYGVSSKTVRFWEKRFLLQDRVPDGTPNRRDD